MAFPRRLLVPGEELILDLRPHWIALLLAILAAVAVAVLGFWWISSVDGQLVWVILALMLVALIAYPVRRLVWWLTSHFVVTTDRIIHREGWFAKRSMEIPLEAINDVRFNQTVFERIIGAGSLIIHSASEAGREEFRAIRHPEEVQKTIYHEGEKNQKRMFQPAAGAAPAFVPPAPATPIAPPGTAPSVITELERLADLRAKGVLTEEEFQAQKARILGQG
jgi:membrane protein YdbS with pleckstrin-like domain